MKFALLNVLLACSGAETEPPPAADSVAQIPEGDPTFELVDIGLASGFQEDTFLDSYQRGRACLTADFDNDGRQDIFVTHPKDTSYLLLNTSADGVVSFAPSGISMDGIGAFGGGPADFDNDGDVDLFLSLAEGQEREDILLVNQLVEEGALRFEEGAEAAGLRSVEMRRSMNSRWGDYDNDGDLDLFVSSGAGGMNLTTDAPEATWQNLVWRNEGDGTFTDATADLGLGAELMSTYQSSWLDVDNDGDLDLYVNNYGDLNQLYINQLAQEGQVRFTEESAEYGLQTEPLDTHFSFVSAVGDMNNDGWQDLVVLNRDQTLTPTERGPRHLLYLNLGAVDRLGFVEASIEAGWTAYEEELGAMGAQLGDLNNDGILDLFVGNGGPEAGNANGLLLSQGWGELEITGAGTIPLPLYADRSDVVALSAETRAGFPGRVLAYPYRTHGTCVTDYDGDGAVEMAITNGGPSSMEAEEVQSPDRLFQMRWSSVPAWLSLRPVGDGATVPRDGTGTRAAVTVRDEDGETWTVHRTLHGGNGFSAHNGFEMRFGLAGAAAIESVEVWWSDGHRELVEGAALNSVVTVER